MNPILQQLINTCLYDFPNPINADPDGIGLVSIGGDLTPPTILKAYSQGLFPWFNHDDEPIAWWSPEPRCVLDPAHYQPSKSLIKQAKKSHWITTVNSDFKQVIESCRLPRSYADETWITETMQSAYLSLHELGFAHSVEVWDSDDKGQPIQLIGGLYGLKLGGIFCGESMFHRESNASKIAFWQLCQHCQQTGVRLIDCQLPNDHLLSLGAAIIERKDFLEQLPELVRANTNSWASTPVRTVKGLTT